MYSVTCLYSTGIRGKGVSLKNTESPVRSYDKCMSRELQMQFSKEGINTKGVFSKTALYKDMI